MSPSDQVLLFVCLRRVLLLYVALSPMAGEMNHRIDGDRFLMCPGCVQERDGGKSFKEHTIADEGVRADDDGSFHAKVVRSVTEVANKEVLDITEVGRGVDDDVSHRKVSSVTEVVVADEVHAITELVGGGVDSVRTITDVDGGDDGDVCHRKVHSITEEDGHADDDEVQAITNGGVGADDDGSDGKLSSASQVLYAARAETNAAAAGKWWHRMQTALPELNSDDGHGQQFDRTVRIQSSIAGSLIATMIMLMVMNGRASGRKRNGRATWFSPAVLMMLLVVAASANSATAVRPLPTAAAGGGRGHNEAAAAAAAAPGMPLTVAAPGHSSCTTDPNTQEPVRCIPH